MKIFTTTPINNKILYKTNTTKASSIPEQLQTNNEIQKKSINEAIGRSQVVSFKGETRTNGNIITHNCSNFWGDKEEISYDKQNGHYTRSLYLSDGNLKEREEYFPATATAIHTNVDKNGDTTVVTSSPYGTETRITDKKGRETYYYNIFKSGDYSEVTTEYDKKRKIIVEVKNGFRKAEVIDLKTNRNVFDGDFVLVTKYDNKSNTYVTSNVLTNQVVRLERFRANGKPSFIQEISQKTNLITREYKYNEKSATAIDTRFHPSGKEASVDIISKEGRKIEHTEYLDDGITEVRHILTEYPRIGKGRIETEYRPNSLYIQHRTKYTATGYTRDFYNSYNQPDHGEVCSGNHIIETYELYEDGKTKKHQCLYNEDGSITEHFQDYDGNKTDTNYIDSSNFKYRHCTYYKSKNVVLDDTVISKKDGSQHTTRYTERGVRETVTKRTSDGFISEFIEYYDDGSVPYQSKKYNRDGSYTFYQYDESGKCYNHYECYANGQRKPYYQQHRTGGQSNNSSSSWGWNTQGAYGSGTNTNGGSGSYSSTNGGYRTSGTNNGYRTSGSDSSYRSTGSERNYRSGRTSSSTSRPHQEMTEKEFIQHVLHIVATKGQGPRNLREEDWKRLASIFEVGDVVSLKDMSIQTYRQLSKKFHPDLHSQDSEEDKARYEDLFKIVNSLKPQSK